MSEVMQNINELIKQEQDARRAIFDYFGYVEDWCIFPFADYRDMVWQIEGSETRGSVISSSSLEEFENGDTYSDEIYTQRFLPKWVYRGKDYTMILIDTHTDGNRLLAIYDNKKEIKSNESNETDETDEANAC